jgi:hypothetical protein
MILPGASFLSRMPTLRQDVPDEPTLLWAQSSYGQQAPWERDEGGLGSPLAPALSDGRPGSLIDQHQRGGKSQ